MLHIKRFLMTCGLTLFIGCPPSTNINPPSPPNPQIPSVCSGDPCASSDCPADPDVDCSPTLPPEEPGPLQPIRGFECNDDFTGETLSVVDGTESDKVLTRLSAAGNCTFDLIYQASSGQESVLSTKASGYMFAAAGTAPSNDVLVCASHYQHRSSEQEGIRFVERIAVNCWVKEPSGNWIGPTEVVSPDGAWAAWVDVLGAKSDGRREYSIQYVRDFTFSPLNAVNEGRPSTDGVYKAPFRVENGAIITDTVEKVADVIYPTANDVYENSSNWEPTEEEREALSDIIDFSDGDCPPPNGCIGGE